MSVLIFSTEEHLKSSAASHAAMRDRAERARRKRDDSVVNAALKLDRRTACEFGLTWVAVPTRR
jgi:hypothetical protein